jgi:hypothetical protein
MSQDIVDIFSTAWARSRAQINDSSGQLSVASLEFKNDHPARVDARPGRQRGQRDQELVNKAKLSTMS